MTTLAKLLGVSALAALAIAHTAEARQYVWCRSDSGSYLIGVQGCDSQHLVIKDRETLSPEELASAEEQLAERRVALVAVAARAREDERRREVDARVAAERAAMEAREKAERDAAEQARLRAEIARERQAAAGRSGHEHTIQRGKWMGCTSKEGYERLTRFAVQGDSEAFLRMVMTGQCVPLPEGAEIFLEDVSLFSGVSAIRLRGATRGLWTATEAIGP